MKTAALDLHRLSRTVNLALPLGLALAFRAGLRVSFYFHFLTVPLLFLTLLNLSYLYLQRKHTLLRNFGIMAQMRYFLESIGPEMRQYLYTSDTEERPFNRLERSEVYRLSKGIDATAAFGSQQEFDENELKLRHSMFPTRPEDMSFDGMAVGGGHEGVEPVALSFPLVVSAMSYGALGGKAVEALSRGAREAGILMNTGEGGYPKYHLKGGADLIFQMGTAKFGVRTEDGRLDENALRDLCARSEIKLVEIKCSQGAKPGKGGILPAEKVSREISELRGVPAGRDVISPPGHVECADAASTVAFIGRVRDVGRVPVGIKLCMGRPGEFHRLVEEMMRQEIFPDHITIDGAEGGTGAAPGVFLDSIGLPLLVALDEARRALEERGVRDRVRLFASGKLINPARQIQALCLGADVCCTARGFMLALGCIQALQCNKNTCPIGITTHDRALTRGFVVAEKARRVANYVDGLRQDYRHVLSAAGVRRVADLSPEHLYIPPGHPVRLHRETGAAA